MSRANSERLSVCNCFLLLWNRGLDRPVIRCPPVSAFLGDKNVHLLCEVRARPGLTALFWTIDNNGTTVSEGEVIDEYWTLVMVGWSPVNAIHTRKHTCTHIHLSVHTPTHLHTHIHTRLRTRTHIHAHVRTHASTHVHMYTQIRIRTRACTRTHTHTHTRTCTHACTQYILWFL